jgi:hypothetical protein
MEPADGATEIEVSTAGVTVNEAEPLTAPEVAVMVVAPWAIPVAIPAGVMVAADTNDEVQTTEAVRSCVLPLL